MRTKGSKNKMMSPMMLLNSETRFKAREMFKKLKPDMTYWQYCRYLVDRPFCGRPDFELKELK